MAHSGKTMTFATDLLPQENSTYNLGNSSKKWKIYADTIEADNITNYVKGNSSIFYGTCDTAAGTLEKEAVVQNGFTTNELVPGAIVLIKFSVTEASSSSTGSLTLDVNGTGAKPIKFLYNGAYTNLPNRNYLKADQVYQFIYDGTNWIIQLMQNSNTTYYYESMYSDTQATTAGKVGITSSYVLPENGGHFAFWLRYSNTAASKLTLAVKNDSTAGTAKDVYLNGIITSSTNYTWPAGFYIGYYDGTNYHFRTDGKLPGDISGNAATVNGHVIEQDIPSNASLTDTKNTAGSTNSTSRLYLIGATSQAENPTTNSYLYTYTNGGLLSALKVGLNLNGTEKARLEWNNTDQSIDFIFE